LETCAEPASAIPCEAGTRNTYLAGSQRFDSSVWPDASCARVGAAGVKRSCSCIRPKRGPSNPPEPSRPMLDGDRAPDSEVRNHRKAYRCGSIISRFHCYRNWQQYPHRLHRHLRRNHRGWSESSIAVRNAHGRAGAAVMHGRGGSHAGCNRISDRRAGLRASRLAAFCVRGGSLAEAVLCNMRPEPAGAG